MKTLRRAGAALSALMLLAGVAIAGSSSASAASDISLIVDNFPAQVRLVPGEKIQIRVTSNVTTGYSWHAYGGCCTKNDKPIAKVSKGTYAAPDNTNGMVGVAGSTTWTITAKRAGTTEITIVTRPPGVQNTMQDEEVAMVTIIVMKPE